MLLVTIFLFALINIATLISPGLLLLEKALGDKIDSASNTFYKSLVLGIAFWSIAGSLIWLLPHATQEWSPILLVPITALILYYKLTVKLLKLITPPLLVTLVFVAFVFSHFTNDEIAKGVDPWELGKRASAYNVPDNYLQWTISDNFYKHRSIERGFNPDKKRMWSAGDRPILAGFLDAVLSRVTTAHDLNYYYIRLILLGACFIFPLFALLRDEFKINASTAKLITLITTINPFIFTNIYFTWPKMAGVTFVLIGFHTLIRIKFDSPKINLISSGIVAATSFAIALLCHTAAVFGIFICAIYIFTTRFKFISGSLNAQFIKSTTPLIPGIILALLILGIHSNYVSTHTNRTNLLARVQLCRNGSYATVTPVVSLQEACSDYYNRVGLSGIVADRQHSLKISFLDGYQEAYDRIISWIFGSMPTTELISAWNTSMLFQPLYAYGVFTMPLAIIIILLNVIFTGTKTEIFNKGAAILFSSTLALVCFGCMLAEYTEMRPHVIPYLIPIGMHVGISLMLLGFRTVLFYALSIVQLISYIAILLFR